MELKDLMAISGYPGLYRFISQGRNSIIVESLEDKKRMSAYSTSRISTLEEIAVYTETGELPLADLLQKMYSHTGGAEALSHKAPAQEIKAFFGEVLPEYDRDRVYVSDMKKIILWYNLLLKYDLLKPQEADKDSPDSTDKPAGAGSDEERADTGQAAKKPPESGKHNV
jgi:hypothetical protein